ncbi:hypothetical protein SUH3_05555 [Pseudosulfitobacter pseudonitzschiae]|uniref:Uncharacterized protein n=1 Tax=Pseudosulfitobacter pseudonitzschiae TaxID=1402135 RepID=A0A073IYH6_9RHOB|nr:hypothetical protein SUH3_05555 [Pseudosulfitobacter pseudonitzschiae]
MLRLVVAGPGAVAVRERPDVAPQHRQVHVYYMLFLSHGFERNAFVGGDRFRQTPGSRLTTQDSVIRKATQKLWQHCIEQVLLVM